MESLSLSIPERFMRVLERGWRTFNAGDLDGHLAIYTEDVRFRSAIIGGVEGSPFHGHDGIRRWWAQLHETFESLGGAPEQAIAFGDHVLAFVRFTGRSREAGVPTSMRMFQLLSLRGDEIADLYMAIDPVEALDELSRRLGG